jgi:hypothetical protein
VAQGGGPEVQICLHVTRGGTGPSAADNAAGGLPTYWARPDAAAVMGGLANPADAGRPGRGVAVVGCGPRTMMADLAKQVWSGRLIGRGLLTGGPGDGADSAKGKTKQSMW